MWPVSEKVNASGQGRVRSAKQACPMDPLVTWHPFLVRSEITSDYSSDLQQW